MKKKIFLVCALVAMSMSAMFVACSKKNEPAAPTTTPTTVTGCNCTIIDAYGDMDKLYVDYSDMKNIYGVSTCSELTQAMKNLYGSELSGVNCN